MTYNLFISHSWAYGDAYDRLIKLLRAKPYFDFRDYSVPKNDPIHNAGTDFQLEQAIKRKMAPASCVLVLAGVYSTYSKWIQKEVQLAKCGFSSPKKIIAIEPRGSQNTSQYVKENADVIVRWNTDSIVQAIRGF